MQETPESKNRQLLQSWLKEVEISLSSDATQTRSGKARRGDVPKDIWRVLVADSFSKQEIVGPDMEDLARGGQPTQHILSPGRFPFTYREENPITDVFKGTAFRQVQEELGTSWRPTLSGDPLGTAFGLAYEHLRNGGDIVTAQQWEFQLIKLVEGQNKGRRAFRAGEVFGLGPDSTEVGDHIIIPLGSRVPFVARKTEGDEYLLIGESFVQGLMNGEVLLTLPEKVTLRLV